VFLRRRGFLNTLLLPALAVGGTGLGWPQAARAVTSLPDALDLQASLARAVQARRPLIVVFSLPQCPWCELARRLSYADLVREGEAVVQVEMVHGPLLRDLDGRPASGREIATRLGVRIAPTALFLGPGGREMAERMVGVGAEDFYDALVRQRLDDARHLAGW